MTTDTKAKFARIGIIVALVVGAYAFGRYAQPAKVVVTEKVVTVEHQVVVTNTVEKAVVQVVRVKDTQKDVHKVEVTETKADGTKVVTVTTDDKSKVQANTTKDATKDVTSQTKDKTLITQTDDKKTVITYNKPSWSLMLQPGFEFGEALGLGNGTSYNLLSKALPMAPRMMVGIGVEHRFVGPLFVGVWASSRLDGGVSLRLEW